MPTPSARSAALKDAPAAAPKFREKEPGRGRGSKDEEEKPPTTTARKKKERKPPAETPCRFWVQGDCRRAEECPYLHDPAIKAGPPTPSARAQAMKAAPCASPNLLKSKKKEKPPISPEKLLKQDRQRAAKAAKHALEAEAKRKEAAMTPEERRAKMVAEAKRLGEERRRKVAEEEARVEAAKEAQRLSIAAKRKEQAALDADAVTAARVARECAAFLRTEEAKKRGAERNQSMRGERSECARRGCGERAERPAVERAASGDAHDRRRRFW